MIPEVANIDDDPEVSEVSGQPMRFGNAQEQTVYDRLSRIVGGGAAAFFHDACKLVQAPPPELETKTHLIGHCLREVEKSIRDVLRPLTSTASTPPSGRRGHCGQSGGHKQDILRILGVLGAGQSEGYASYWLELTGPESGLARDAHRDGLRPARAPDEAWYLRWSRLVYLFDWVLDRAEASFFKYEQLIEDLFNEVSRDQRVKTLKTLPHTEAIQRALFRRAEHPEWIGIFEAAQYFDHPPSPVREGNIVRYPSWSASAYLSRMAVKAPGDVARIVNKMPIPDNPIVHAELLLAASHFRLDELGDLPARELTWLQCQRDLHYYEERAVVQFVQRLVTLRHPLGIALLEQFLRPVERAVDPIGGQDSPAMPPEPQGLMEPWEFGTRMIEDILPLVEFLGLQGLEVFVCTLDSALRLSQREGEEGYEDHSFIWRQSLDGEEHGQKSSYRDVIIDATLAYSERLIELDPGNALPSVKACLKFPWPLHKRLALLIMRRHLDLLRDYATETLLLEDVLCNDRLHHEVYWLLHDLFPQLSDAEKSALLTTLSQQVDDIDDESTMMAAQRRRNLFEAIASHLPAKWRDYYELLAAERPASEHPDYLVYSRGGVFRGPDSPLSEQELEAMSVPHLLDYLRSWKPGGEWHAPSSEGLGHCLSRVVSRNPQPYAEQAQGFKDLGAEYVNALLGGLESAVRSERSFDWSAPVELMGVVVRQDASLLQPRHGGSRGYPVWTWAITATARLLSTAFRAKLLAFDQWDASINILETILRNDELRKQEAQWEQSDDSYQNIAANIPRGIAIEALIELGVHITSTRASQPVTDTEVQAENKAAQARLIAILERHLDLSVERSLAIRALYGASLGQLLHIDMAWTEAQCCDLFDVSGEAKHYGLAAWQGFIMVLPPRTSFLHVVRSQYQQAIERLGTQRSSQYRQDSEETHLGHHLLMYYCWGSIELSASTPSMAGFFARAPKAIARAVIGEFGRTLWRENNELPAETKHRIAMLGDYLVATHPSVLDKSGWWLASELMDPEWVLTILQGLGAKRVLAEPDHLTVKRLNELVSDHPQAVLTCLDHIVQLVTDSHSVHGWIVDAKAILSHCDNHDNVAIRDLSKRVRSRLIAKGFEEF
jgi:hypothetical protein